jgi:hypothetical protein
MCVVAILPLLILLSLNLVVSCLIPHSALVGVKEYDGKVKKCNISKIVIAISHPDQWDFWEWLGQTPRLV